jgi:hypothetical protein
MFVEQLTSAMQCGIPEAQVPVDPRFVVSGRLRACQREQYHCRVEPTMFHGRSTSSAAWSS